MSVTSTLSLHDALPISTTSWKRGELSSSVTAPKALTLLASDGGLVYVMPRKSSMILANSENTKGPIAVVSKQLCIRSSRSEEHTSELQSPCNLVCRLLL